MRVRDDRSMMMMNNDCKKVWIERDRLEIVEAKLNNMNKIEESRGCLGCKGYGCIRVTRLIGAAYKILYNLYTFHNMFYSFYTRVLQVTTPCIK
ncbi:hypothetical protein Hanom_Chr12g01168521 [Helianthus anomalus]